MAEAQTPVPGGKVRWTRLAALGFAFAAAAPLVMLIAGAAFGLDLADAVFLVMPIALYALLAFLVWRFGTWAKVVANILGLLGARRFFWLIFGLFEPGSFFDFVPGVLFLPGVVMGVVSSIGAIVAQGRGHRTMRAEGGEARGIRIALTVVAALTILSGVLTVAMRSSADASVADERVAMKNFAFAPEEFSVAGGSTIYVGNEDPFLHTFTVDELGIDERFTVGTSRLITVPAEPGTYVFYCTPHSDPDSPDPDDDDMAGRLTVT